jgi:hypothetical protein
MMQRRAPACSEQSSPATLRLETEVVETNSAVVRFYEEAGYEIEPGVSMSKRPPSKI